MKCCFTFLLFSVLLIKAQTRPIDSLFKLASAARQDTLQVRHLNLLGAELLNEGLLERADSAAGLALRLAEQLKYGRGICQALNNKGMIHFTSEDYPQALQYFTRALRLAEELQNKFEIARNVKSIAYVHYTQGDFLPSLQYFFKNLKVNEEMGRKKEIASTLGNIGSIYDNLQQYDKALEYELKAVAMYEALGDKRAVGLNLGNVGNVYYGMKDYKKALEYQHRALKIAEELDDQAGVATNLTNISGVCADMGNLSEAMQYVMRALKLRESLQDGAGMAYSLYNMGSLYARMNKNREAETYMRKALDISEQLGDLHTQKEICREMSLLYSSSNNWKAAFEKYRQFIAARDSIFNEENTRNTVKVQMQYEFDKRSTADSLKAADERRIAKIELGHEQSKRYVLYGGLSLALVFTGFIFNRFKVTQKQKLIIEKKNQLIEEHQKEIIDSIHYAKRIQFALLAGEELLARHLPEYFAFFQPKDIVAGDFYWAAPTPQGFLYITADCTGHGVPGAFMSLLNIGKLNEAVNQKQIYRPDAILNDVRDEIVEALNPKGSSTPSRDGMDAVLCQLDMANMKLKYAAANNSFYIVRNKTVMHCAADKMPVGLHAHNKPFTHQEVDLQKGDVIYTFSDGYPDQFGGPKGKKFKYKQLEELLLAISHLPMVRQKDILEQRLNEWKGALEQVDDVCVIGVRV